MLSWFTICYNVVEGVVSMAFGYAENSVALFGFGADSFIEVASAFLVLWRFRGETGEGGPLSLERERKTTLGIGLLFLLLAVGALAGGAIQLWQHSHPETTMPGLIVSALSLSFMFFLWKAKRNVGQALGSTTVMKDAACSLACIQLSAVLFAGSLVFMIAPSFWWADSAAAIILSGFIAKEGWETVEAARSEDFAGGGCGCHE
jgi:divalent metal cation (Fe/Co/Zn/Cd) transporter